MKARFGPVFRGIFDDFRQILAARLDRGPISDVDSMIRFARTRAAYVAQTALYGYLKARMGTSYQRHFEDDEFSRAIRESAVKLFVSCLSDLTVFTVRSVGAGARMREDDAVGLARHCFHAALGHEIGRDDSFVDFAEALANFDARADAASWSNPPRADAEFAGSAADLIRLAPVVDEFKEADENIVTNSIRFRWRNVREQFHKRADGNAIQLDWRRVSGGE